MGDAVTSCPDDVGVLREPRKMTASATKIAAKAIMIAGPRRLIHTPVLQAGT
ncbi:hypothetical protein [Sphingomonas sp. F9_3S_D5_B_2]